MYKSHLNTCMHPNHVFRVQTSPWYGWNSVFPGGLVKKTSHRVDSFVQTRFVQKDGKHALLQCTHQQRTRIMPSGHDFPYAPPAKPSFLPCFREERAEKSSQRSISLYTAAAYRHGFQGIPFGDGGAPAPCGFQRLAWVGNGLDGELVVLRARTGPVTSSDRLRHPCGHDRFLPLAPAETRTPPSHHRPL